MATLAKAAKRQHVHREAQFNKKLDLKHDWGPLPQHSPEKIHELCRNRESRGGSGAPIYNIAGPEDLLVGQDSLAKSSRMRKPCRETVEQAEARVPSFHRTCWSNTKSRGGTLESVDMYVIMNGDTWNKPSKALDTLANVSGAPASAQEGTLTDAERTRTCRIQHDFQTSEYQPWSSGWPEIKPTSMIDWGGMNGLGIWKYATATADRGPQNNNFTARGDQGFVDYSAPAVAADYGAPSEGGFGV